MPEYGNTRIIKGLENNIMVQVQFDSNFNWKTVKRFNKCDYDKAKVLAIRLAQFLSIDTYQLITVYDELGRSIISFVNGEAQ